MSSKEYHNAVHAHADNLYRFALSLTRDEEYAKDLVQECYTKLWEKKDSVRFQKVKSYLFTMLHRSVIDAHRKEKHRQTFESIQTVNKTNYQPPSDLQDILHRAMSLLPDIQKSVLLLRDYEGYSYQEIGEMTKLKESQVKVYIFRARQQMKATSEKWRS